jgi:hypothetical protein
MYKYLLLLSLVGCNCNRAKLVNTNPKEIRPIAIDNTNGVLYYAYSNGYGGGLSCVKVK